MWQTTYIYTYVIRKCVFIFHVIEYFNVYFENCSGRSGKIALELIRDLPNLESKFPRTVSEAVTKYTASATATATDQRKLEDDTNMKYLMATILYRLAHHLNAPPSFTDAEISQRQAAAAENFRAVTKQALPTGFEVGKVIFPTLGPQIALGEDKLEAYNRTYNLLRSVSHVLAPTRWSDKYTKDGADPFQTLNVHATAIPRWMVEVKPTTDLANTMRSAPLPQKSIRLCWDRTKKTAHTEALTTHIQDFVEFNELQLPKTDEVCAKDPRVFPTGEMWRDTVRRQLHLQDLRVDISTMQVIAPDESEVVNTLLVYGRGEPATWDDVRKLLVCSNAKASFSYTLKPLGEDEDFEWEHQGPPLALLKEVCLGSDDDVEIRRQPEPGPSTITHSPPPQGGIGETVVGETAQPLDDEDQAAINAFLSEGGGINERKPAIPESEFSPNDRALMLTQHDGIDVFTPEGLREWQMRAINVTAGQQPKLVKDLGFKDNPNVSSKQRRELLEHREQGEIAALSVDVCSIHCLPPQIDMKLTSSSPLRSRVMAGTTKSKRHSQAQRLK